MRRATPCEILLEPPGLAIQDRRAARTVRPRAPSRGAYGRGNCSPACEPRRTLVRGSKALHRAQHRDAALAPRQDDGRPLLCGTMDAMKAGRRDACSIRILWQHIMSMCGPRLLAPGGQ
jgi:hypothetical protein